VVAYKSTFFKAVKQWMATIEQKKFFPEDLETSSCLKARTEDVEAHPGAM
jgi:hypothetical protein